MERLKEKREGVSIAVIVLCCMLMNYILNIINSNMLYIAIMGANLLFFLFTVKKIIISKNINTASLWWLAVIAMALSTFRSSFDVNTYVDVYVFFICTVFISLCSGSSRLFKPAIKVMFCFSVYYAISIWIQLLIPSTYQLFLTLIPRRNSSFITEFDSLNSGYTGFTTNPGFTAGYVVTGLLWLFSLYLYRKAVKVKIRLSFIVTILFMLVSLLLTGKRGHLLAFVVSAIVIYLLSTRGKEKFTRFGYVLTGIAVFLILILCAGEFFAFIPGVSRINETIMGLIQGEDISNNRAELYAFAMQLFKENPLFGVGWGQYRRLTVGNVTLIRTIEAHNIYLQMLCEMGIIGTICMIIPMFSSLRLAAKCLKEAVVYHDMEWYPLLSFGLGYQTFFLVYGITGNPLYDHNCVLLYMVSIMICVVFSKKSRYMIDNKHNYYMG